MTLWLFLVIGVAAGALHSASIGRSLGSRHSPFRSLLRLLGAVLVLFLAAKQGQIVACAAAWGASFLFTSFWVYRRLS